MSIECAICERDRRGGHAADCPRNAKKGKRPSRLTANQLHVLRLACTHGHVTQGCCGQSEFGGRASTIYSLRRRGLLDAMDQPTEAGRKLLLLSETPNVANEAGKRPAPN